jgi:hypothetical protein
VTAFLVDEMFSMAVAELLRETYGHDAVHVAEVGLRAADDSHVAARARAEDRAVVTENVADFAGERDLVLVFVRRGICQPGAGNLPLSRGSSIAGCRTTRTPTSVPTGLEWTKQHSRVSTEPDRGRRARVREMRSGTDEGTSDAGYGFSERRQHQPGWLGGGRHGTTRMTRAGTAPAGRGRFKS